MVKDLNIVTWLLLGALLLVLLNLPDSATRQIKGALREGIAPLQSLLANTSRKSREGLRTMRGFGTLAAENERLSAELIRLSLEVEQLKSLERENLELLGLLRFSQTEKRSLLPAAVIARDISGWWQTVRLNRGAADGVEAPRAVITTGGVIGKTVDVSMRTCDVLMLSDPSCRVSARVGGSKAFGIVSGRGVSWNGEVMLTMEFINKSLPVRPGEEVFTSGLGGVFPEGLPIGYVHKVYRDRNDLYQRADILPRADFTDLNYVFVLLEEEDEAARLLLQPLPGGSAP